MKEHKKIELKERLALLDSRERQKLYKRAAVLRKANRKPETSRTSAFDIDDDAVVSPRRNKDTLDDWVLKILEQEEPVNPDLDRVQTSEGCVVWLGAGACRVQVPGAEIECDLPRNITRCQQSLIAVGDRVVVRRQEGGNLLASINPRRTKLSRPDPGNRNIERLIVANVDVVVITISVKTPPLHPRLIDRYLIAIQRGGAQPMICVNKLDLLQDDWERREELRKLDPYERLGIDLTRCSTLTHEGMAQLRCAIEGKRCAFVGHSGVGKSSILNALHPELGLITDSVSLGYGRGRHTTTASNMYHLGSATYLIDTPGVRSFGLERMDAQELGWFFPEFESFSQLCKFRNCTHDHEPKCGVQRAVQRDLLPRERYETYLRLLRE